MAYVSSAMWSSHMDARIAHGGRVDESEGHISVTIPYPTYRRILAYLPAIQSPLEPEELIASIPDGCVDPECLVGGVGPSV
jgi:hypothetical protein